MVIFYIFVFYCTHVSEYRPEGKIAIGRLWIHPNSHRRQSTHCSSFNLGEEQLESRPFVMKITTRGERGFNICMHLRNILYMWHYVVLCCWVQVSLIPKYRWRDSSLFYPVTDRPLDLLVSQSIFNTRVQYNCTNVYR